MEMDISPHWITHTVSRKRARSPDSGESGTENRPMVSLPPLVVAGSINWFHPQKRPLLSTRTNTSASVATSTFKIQPVADTGTHTRQHPTEDWVRRTGGLRLDSPSINAVGLVSG